MPTFAIVSSALLLFLYSGSAFAQWSPNHATRSQKVAKRVQTAIVNAPTDQALFAQFVRHTSKTQRKKLILSLDPQNPEQAILIAKIHDQLGDNDQAVAVLQQHHYEKPAQLLIRAKVRLTVHDWENALVDLKDALAASKRSEKKRILTKIIDLLKQQRLIAQSIPFQNQRLTVSSSWQNYAELARTHLSLGNQHLALRNYVRATEMSQDAKVRTTLLIERGDLHSVTQNYDAALDRYNDAEQLSRATWVRTEIQNKRIELHRTRGTLASHTQQLNARWSQHSVDFRLTVCDLLIEVSNYSGAIKRLKSLAKGHHQSRVRERLAHLYIITKQPGKTEKLLRDALRKNPNKFALRQALADHLHRQERPNDARATLSDGRHTPDLDLQRAQTLQQWGDPLSAKRIYTKTLKAHPQHRRTRIELGKLIASNGDLTGAMELWAFLNSDDAIDVAEYAELMSQFGDQERATDAIKKAIGRNPARRDLADKLARQQEKSGDFSAALDHWIRRFSELKSPRFIDAIERAARRSGRVKEVRDFAMKRITEDPRFGLLAYRFVDDQDAIVELMVTGALKNNDREFASRVLETHASRMLGALEYEKAIQLWGRAKTVNARRAMFVNERISEVLHALPDSLTHKTIDTLTDDGRLSAHTHANIYYVKPDEADSLLHLRAAVKGVPNHEKYLYDLADALYSTEPKQARDLYLRIITLNSKLSVASALNAIDLSSDAKEIGTLEKFVWSLRDELNPNYFRSIALDLYDVVISDSDGSLNPKLARRAITSLIRVVQSKHASEYQKGMALLQHFDTQIVFPELTKSLHPKTSPKQVLSWVLTSGHPSAIPLIRKTLHHKNLDKRRLAMIGIGKQRQKGLSSLLAKDATSGTELDRTIAILALGERRDSDANALIANCWRHEKSDRVRRAIVWAMGRSRHQVFSKELKALVSQNALISKVAVAALATMENDAAATTLLELWWQGDAEIRTRAERGIQLASSKFTSKLMERSDDGHEYDRVNHFISVVDHAAQIEIKAPLVDYVTKHPKPTVATATRALSQTRGAVVLADLIRLGLETKQNAALRPQVNRIIRGIRPALIRELNAGRNLDALTVVLPMAGHAADVRTVVMLINDIESNAAAAAAIENLNWYDWPRVSKTVTVMLADDDLTVRRSAAVAIAGFPDEHLAKDTALQSALLERLQDSDNGVRVAVAATLSRVATEDAVAELKATYSFQPIAVRSRILKTLDRIDTPNSNSVRAQLELIPDINLCEGDQKRLDLLVEDECLGVFLVDDVDTTP